MSAKHFIVATAGHVDHGKSTLVKALTGIDPDRLPEEKARGITIDLGFAHLDLGDARLGIVDVPGHEDFVKNMVAGVGSIDLALFVVAADDGWMPQSEEHLQILAYLGVGRAVVALTKVDLAQEETARITRVREQLAGTPFSEAAIVPVSAVSGRGLEELKTALARALADAAPQPDLGKPRLAIDRVFTLRGVGTVVTGALTGGALRRGQEVVIQPSGRKARIRSVQTHGHDVEASGPGMRTALNLPDLTVEQIQRGEVVTLAELGGPRETLDVVLEISPRATRPLKDGARVRIHHGSGNVAARVGLRGTKELGVGQRACAQFWLEAPFFVFAGDRFIVRDWPEQRTLAGGVIVERGISNSEFSIADLVLATLARQGAARAGALLVQSRFSAEEITAEIERLARAGRVVRSGEFVADAAWWAALRRKAEGVIDAHHRAHPEQPGLPLRDLPSALGVGDVALGEALIADLCESEFAKIGAAICRATHRPALPAALRAAGEKVRAALSAQSLDPPSRKEIAPDAAMQQALRFLLQTGEAVELSDEVVLRADAFARATEIVCAELKRRGSATAGELRQALGSSRRVTIPLLERLDRDGVTLRQGQRRMLRKSA